MSESAWELSEFRRVGRAKPSDSRRDVLDGQDAPDHWEPTCETIQCFIMPELPEVETMRRGILNVVGGVVRGIDRIRTPVRPIRIVPPMPTFRRRAVGQRITGVARLGKRVLVQLESDDRIVFEPRMTGLVLLTDPPTTRHLRVRMRLDQCPAEELLFWDQRGLGLVQLWEPDEFRDRQSALGPDALDVTRAEMSRQMRGQRPIKVALLDQKKIAGVGNLYASEILHRARIHPETPCQALRTRQWTRIHTSMIAILNEAIRYEGSTLSDGTYRNALNQDGQYQNQHRVYDRGGQKCLDCRRATIRRIVQAQRSTFFCPKCQQQR